MLYLDISELKTEKIDVEIVDASGHVLLRKQEYEGGLTVFNLSDLPAGNYYIRIRNDEASVVRKFSIIH